MPKVAPIDQRKADHIKINLEKDVRSALTTGLENYHFLHEALPELDLDQIDTSLSLFGKQLAAPILISSMTGGTADAEVINLRLAEAAQEVKIAMGVGSQRAAIEHPEQAKTFQVRRAAPDILLFANLGAVQLNYGYGIDQCRRAVEMIGADALILHLNPLQEAVQDAGDTNFAGLAKKIEEVCKQIDVPVIAKEVGWGISERTAKRLGRLRCLRHRRRRRRRHKLVPGGDAPRTRRVHAPAGSNLCRLGHPHRQLDFECEESCPGYDRLCQRRHQGWIGYCQMCRSWCHARGNGRTVPESRRCIH